MEVSIGLCCFANYRETNVRDSVVGDTDGAGLALGELGHGYEE
jgi:hypothetical protein